MKEEKIHRVEAVSGVNQRGEGFVHIVFEHDGRREVSQATPAEAREFAQHILEAAEAAETDSFIVQFMRNKVGLDMERAGHVLVDFRRYRELSGGVKNREATDAHWLDMLRKNGARKDNEPFDPSRKSGGGPK